MDDTTVVTPVITPVFVDASGRRRKRVRTLSVAAVSAVVMVGGLLLLALLGAPIGPVTFLPDQPAPQVDAEPTAGGTDAPTTAPPTGRQPAGSRSPAGASAVPPTRNSPPSTERSNVTPTQAANTPNKPEHTPPGRPSGLPQPPSRTR